MNSLEQARKLVGCRCREDYGGDYHSDDCRAATVPILAALDAARAEEREACRLPLRCKQCDGYICEIAGLADELAFWKHQAVFHYAVMYHQRFCPVCNGTGVVKDGAHHSGLIKDYGGKTCPGCGRYASRRNPSNDVMQKAERQLEEARHAENRERVAHAEAPRDIGT